MKKIYALIFILLLIKVNGQIPNYYYQYFEPNAQNNLLVTVGTNTDNVWQIGAPSKTLFTAASTTPNAIVTLTSGVYPKGNVSTFSFAVAHYTTCNFCPYALQWNQKLDMEFGKDGGIVEFSNDGQTWQNALVSSSTYQFYGFMPGSVSSTSGQACFSGTDNAWRSIWLCLSAPVANVNDSIFYRFTFRSDTVQTSQEGWMIDNVFAHVTAMHPIKENSLPDRTLIYPNITNGMVNVEARIKGTANKIDNICLTDLDGKVIEDYGQNFAKTTLDLSKHPSGTYFIRVRIGKVVENHTVIYSKD
jgi:hypothetical protein